MNDLDLDDVAATPVKNQEIDPLPTDGILGKISESDGVLLDVERTPGIDRNAVLAVREIIPKVEDAFRETKTYLEMRPIYHLKDDRVRNHIRICFLAYWITARLKAEWRLKSERREVSLVLRELQQIKVGRLKINDKPFKVVLTDIPRKLYALLEDLGLLHLFQRAPAWAS
jgi:hypothetical protein